MVKANMLDLVEIVSSRVKAEIFRVLFVPENPELHLREIVRQSRLALATVQQELARLARIGLITPRRDGNRLYFRANPEHPIYAELTGMVFKTSGLAGVLRQALTTAAITNAFVFGSIARNEANAASDIDLMVIGSISLRALSARLSGLTAKLNREINPHILSAEEFCQRRRKKNHFLASVLLSPKIFIVGNEHELEAMGEERLVEAPSNKSQ